MILALSFSARVLSTLRRTLHAISKADANVLVASASNAVVFRRTFIGIAALASGCVGVADLPKIIILAIRSAGDYFIGCAA